MKIVPEALLLFFLYSVFPSLKAQPAEGMESLHWSECDTVVVSSPQIRLPAIVTTPKGEGKNFPVCVLLGGSGPTDKDGTLGPTKFLRDLAQGLAERANSTTKDGSDVLMLLWNCAIPRTLTSRVAVSNTSEDPVWTTSLPVVVVQ